MKKILSLIFAVVLLSSVFALSCAAAPAPKKDFTAEVKCSLKGEYPADLKEVFDVEMVTAEERNLVSAVKVDMNKSAKMQTIEFFEPDTFAYIVSQKKGKNADISYDKTRYLVTVMVEVNDNDELNCVYSIANYDTGKKVDAIEFVNTYDVGSPETGDTSNLAMWIIPYAVLSAIAAYAGIYIISHKNRESGR